MGRAFLSCILLLLMAEEVLGEPSSGAPFHKSHLADTCQGEEFNDDNSLLQVGAPPGHRSWPQVAPPPNSATPARVYCEDDPTKGYCPFYSPLRQSINAEYPPNNTQYAEFPQGVLAGTLAWAVPTKDSSPSHSKWAGLDEVGRALSPTSLSFGFFNLSAPGSLRTPHWHSNSAEVSYIISGRGRISMTKLPHRDIAGAPVSLRRPTETFAVGPGDAFYAPVGYHHYFESIDPTENLFGLAIFDTDNLKTFDFPQVLRVMDREFLAHVLNIPNSVVDSWNFYNRTVIDPAYPDYSPSRTEVSLTVHPDFKIRGVNRDLVPSPRQDLHGRVATHTISKSEGSTYSRILNFALGYTEMAPGALLEPYWNDNADEVFMVIEGSELKVSRAGSSPGDNKTGTFMVGRYDLFLCETGLTCWINNNGKSKAKLLRIWNNPQPTLTNVYDAYYGLPVDVAGTMFYKQRAHSQFRR
jgi:mannose-6-phosphate isomerase-like protein (cupin superfamily)